jgi:hypothetical protein
MSTHKRNTRSPSFSETVPATGSFTEVFPDCEAIRKSRLQVATVGANCTIKTQESIDGVNWVDLNSETTTGLKTAVSPFAKHVRTRVENAGGSGEACAWSFMNEYDYYDVTRG